jgi:hypothetical protein
MQQSPRSKGRTDGRSPQNNFESMEGFLHTDPKKLLKEHCHLLFSDFAALASGPTKNKLEWISEIDSALGAASHMAGGRSHVAEWLSDALSSRCPGFKTSAWRT